MIFPYRNLLQHDMGVLSMYIRQNNSRPTTLRLKFDLFYQKSSILFEKYHTLAMRLTRYSTHYGNLILVY